MIFNVRKLNKELEAVKADNAKLLEAIASKEKELAEAHKNAEELAASNVELDKQLEDAKAEIAKVKDSAKADVEAAKTAANKQAANIVASIGVAEGTIPESKEELMTPEKAASQFNSLKGVARSEFFRKYEAEILKGMGVKR
jgi:chromosome segregation ATPase